MLAVPSQVADGERETMEPGRCTPSGRRTLLHKASRWAPTGDADGTVAWQDHELVFSEGDGVYRAIVASDDFELDSLSGERIPPEAMYCEAWDAITPADDDARVLGYLKAPNPLGRATGCTSTAEAMADEVRAYEMLRHSPHRLICSYLGCVVSEGRVRSICLEPLRETLHDIVRRGEGVSCALAVLDLRGALDHLHSMGYVHGDVNPGNIMARDDGTLVLVDLDSCRKVGAEAGAKRGTPQWSRELATTSVHSDFIGLSLSYLYALGLYAPGSHTALLIDMPETSYEPLDLGPGATAQARPVEQRQAQRQQHRQRSR